MKKCSLSAGGIFVIFMLTVTLLTGCNSSDINLSDSNVHPELFRDRDALLERIEWMDDFEGVTYSDSDLAALRIIPESKDYKLVLKAFVADKLDKELETFQTIQPYSEERPFRTLIVTTEDHSVYRITLKKLPDNDGIWVVDMFAELIWKTYPIPDSFH